MDHAVHGQFGQVLPFIDDCATARFKNPANEVKQGRFACAVRTDNSMQSMTFNLDAHVIHRSQTAKIAA